jgi:hypothetical protein
MKYLLIVFGDFKGKTKYVNSVAKSISIISDTEETKFTYGDATIVMNFISSVDKEEVYLFVDELLRDTTTLYFLTPYTDLVYTSLPIDIHSHLFGITETDLNDIYEDNILDLDNAQTRKKEKESVKSEQKTLSLDDILDKINSEGMYSLTEQERKTLEIHSNRI